jgi:hypothetical protein
MNGKEKGRQLVSHFLRWSGVFRSSRSLRNVQLRYAGILLEGFLKTSIHSASEKPAIFSKGSNLKSFAKRRGSFAADCKARE